MLRGESDQMANSQGGYLNYASSHALHEREEAPVGIIEWKSWKLSRKCRSSLSAKSQAMADFIDVLNFIRFSLPIVFPPFLMSTQVTILLLQGFVENLPYKLVYTV